MKTTLHTSYLGNLILKDGELQMYRFAGGYASFDADTIGGYAFNLGPIPFDRSYARDPLAEKYYSISPYAYCAGDPVNLVDPEGRAIIFVNGYRIFHGHHVMSTSRTRRCNNQGVYQAGNKDYWKGIDTDYINI